MTIKTFGLLGGSSPWVQDLVVVRKTRVGTRARRGACATLGPIRRSRMSSIWTSLGDLFNGGVTPPKKPQTDSDRDEPQTPPRKDTPQSPRSVKAVSLATEYAVGLSSVVEAMKELEEAHERSVATLRTKEAEMKATEEAWEAKLQQKEEEWQASENETSAQLGTLTQKNAQMRVEIKHSTKRCSDLEGELEAERAAHLALQQVAEDRLVENDDGDAELAELDANTSRRIEDNGTNDRMSGTGVVRLTNSTVSPSFNKYGTPSPVGSSPRETPTTGLDVQLQLSDSTAAKPGGCCSLS